MNLSVLVAVADVLFSFDPETARYSCYNLKLDGKASVVQERNCGWMFPSVYPPRNPLDSVKEFRLRTAAPSGQGALATLELKRRGEEKTIRIQRPWTDDIVFPVEGAKNSGLSVHALVFHLPRGVNRGRYSLGPLVCVRSCSPAEDIRFDIDTGSPIHLLAEDQSSAQATFRNDGEERRNFRVRMTVRDWRGGTKEENFAAELGPGESRKFGFAVPDGYGANYVRSEISCGATSVVRTASFARVPHHEVTPRLAGGKFRIGINYHMRRYAPRDRELTLRAIDASGAKIVRGIGASMHEICPSKDACDWAETDRLVDELLKHGLDINLGVWGTPRWLADETHRTNADWRVWARSVPPERPYAEHLKSLARRYRGKIAYYEIGNEWDMIPAVAMTIDEGIAAQRNAYRAIREGDPEAIVEPNAWSFPDSGPKNVAQKGFQERLLCEARGSYDVHAIHLHGSYAQYRKDLASFLAMRERLKVEAPWFDNECAQPTMYGNDQQVADCVWQKTLYAWSKGSVDFLWYNLRATGYDHDDWEQGYGLVTPDYHPRASYAAFAALTKVFTGLDFKRTVDDGERRSVFVFSSDGGVKSTTVIAGWDYDGKSEYRIGTDARTAEIVDLFGNRRRVEIKNGSFTWRPSRRPGCVVLYECAVPVAVEHSPLRDDSSF